MGQEEKLCDEVETVSEFTYLGDKMSAYGGSEAAVTARTRCWWVKHRECVELVYGRIFHLRLKGDVCKSYVRPAILNGGKARYLKESEMGILQRTEIFIVRVMCRVKLKVRKRSTDLMFMLGLKETIDQLAMANSVRWYGHVLRREDGHVLRRALDLEVDGQRKKGRPKRTWKKQVEEESMKVGLRMENELCRLKRSAGVNKIAAGCLSLSFPFPYMTSSTVIEYLCQI